MGAVKADIFSSTGGATGVLGFPSGTTNQRPNPAQEGFTRYNTDIGAIEIYYSGTWNKLSSGASGGADGSSSSNAFANLEDIVGLYDNGTHNLWTTVGGNVSAFQMPICFDNGGPWYVLSFNFPTYGFNEVNNTLWSWAYNTGTSSALKNIHDDRVHHHFSRSSNQYGWQMANAERYREAMAGIGGSGVSGYNQTNGGGGNSGYVGINYYNHATNSNFTTSQLNALRDTVSQLSHLTPHYSFTADSDSNGTGSVGNWEVDNDETTLGYGHCNWIKDKNGTVQRTSNGFENSDNNGFVGFWTHNQYSRTSIPYNWNWAQTVGNPQGLRSNALIIPNEIKGYTGSGGGSTFGTYFSGAVGKMNNRAIFLCR